MMRNRGWVVALSCAVLGAARVAAQPPTPPDSIVVTHGQVVVHGKPIRYTARAGMLPLLENDTGELMGRIFFVSYTADRAPGDSPRPLTFLWNGGPGSSASQVHVVGFGPKHIKTADTYPAWGPNTETAIVEHPETWLDTSDLVFVDPPGTGFSRATTTEYRDILYTTRGDAEAVAEFIRLYCTRFNAWNVPHFIAGESYGTTRAMEVAAALEKRRHRLAGVLLISGGFNVGQQVPRATSDALQLSLYAATAHYHKRLPSELQSLSRDEAVKQAVEWARTVYAPALARRDSLSTSERNTVLAGLQRYTGLGAGAIDARTLTIAKDQFMDRLLADKGLELGRYDSRMTKPFRGASVQWLPFIDPSLMPMIDLMQGTSRLFNSYVHDTLRYRSDLLYRGPFGEAFHPRPLPIGPNGFATDWMTNMFKVGPDGALGEGAPARGQGGAARGGGGGRGAGGAADPEQPAAAPPLRRAMELNPKLRVMSALGMYDGSCAARDEAVARTEPELRRRIVNHCYAGGHMMYSDTQVRREMQRDFAAFVRDAAAASAAVSQ